MRVDCKFYESRTYASGETVRMCRLDLAPEAPWRCPENCPKYQLKMSDGGWVHGSLAVTPPPPGPTDPGENVAALLDQAEDIINAAGPGIIADVETERTRRETLRSQARRRWWPFGRRS